MIYRGYKILGEDRIYQSWEIDKEGNFTKLLDTDNSAEWQYIVYCKWDDEWEMTDITDTFEQAKEIIDREIAKVEEKVNAS